MSAWELIFLGPEGTHSHEAADCIASSLFAGQPVDQVAMQSFDDIFEAPRSAHRLACVPIENSIQGSVWQVWDALTREHLQEGARQILAAVTLPIHHYAMYRDGIDLDQVDEVVSHPQALAQCKEHIRRHFPGAREVAVSSTAEAARQIARGERARAVAIGSRRAAQSYGLSVAPEPFEDRPGNVTRFALVGSPDVAFAPPSWRLTDWTASLCLRGVPHRPGGLALALHTFAAANLNLTRLESRPVGDAIGNYVYYLDASVWPYADRGERVLAVVRELLMLQGVEVLTLGVYPVYSPSA
ncbi:prephenate dehydratase [Alicyclobacillus sendaiensis]|uniref:prephenate dehydratase n=1 Tax=Alicyclobacillus sendaiensis TaxID=192387 RepID=UPI000784CA4C|nr:prephenate dehydratase domain-containing protein [Alicyclobacillus sendaiensis]